MVIVFMAALVTGCSDDDRSPSGKDCGLDQGGADLEQNRDVSEGGASDRGGLQPDQGVKSGGFGDTCSKTAPCTSGLECFYFTQGAPSGFCSKTCTDVTKACTGGSPGTMPYCVLQAGSSYYCAFICKVVHSGHEHTYPCPSALTCNPLLIPPSTSSYLCIP
jgi:hypothetical protein